VLQVEEILSKDKDIFGYFEVIGWGGAGDSAMAFVPLQDWSLRSRSQEQIKNELNKQFVAIPGMSVFAVNPRSLGGGSNKPIEFNLQTSLEYSEFDIVTQNFINKMKTKNIFQNIERDFKASTPTIDIVVNREKAYRYGADLDTIGKTVQYLMAGRQVGDFRIGHDIYTVMLRFDQSRRNTADSVKNIMIKTSSGQLLPIEVLADLQEKIAVKAYNHYNNSRAITISADLAQGRNITEAIAAIDEIAQELVDQNTTTLEYLGEIKRMAESSGGTLVTFAFALIFIFLVLSAQFESFGDALLILMAVPFSITGGVLALLLFDNTLNMYSNIGLVTLIGLVTKNSIMLVEFANQLRETGHKISEAVIISAKLRFRPILMTSVATICGAIPLVLASGAGAASRNSIGIVVIGGMLLGTIFTIFVIPVLYQAFKKDAA
jgi:HAE1 family hydrophobic/amphiphilic exporter-1